MATKYGKPKPGYKRIIRKWVTRNGKRIYAKTVFVFDVPVK